MQLNLIKISALIIFIFVFALSAAAQSGSTGQKGAENRKKETRPVVEKRQEKPVEPDEPDDDNQSTEVVKVDTNLVTVPVIASDRDDRYVPDMQKEEFRILEDGVKQDVTFFATITQPFHVILMLDTSASTQEKLKQIQSAAIAFVQQLQPADRVKVVAFDDELQDLNEFTNDQTQLRAAIRKIRPGMGTKLYDAVQFSLDTLRTIKGRKAVVMLTDGVDNRSDYWKSKDNIKMLDESGIIMYPIRYDTRVETEQLVRQQSETPQMTDPSVIMGLPRGTTPTTFPGGNIPTGGGRPSPPVSNPRDTRRTNDPRYPPDNNGGMGRISDPSLKRSTGPEEDLISTRLDMMYKIADEFLNDLAVKSGGKLTRADTLRSLPAAFAEIAAELRTQYSLGYYPVNRTHDSKYRKIQVKTTRKDVVVRARPGYRPPDGIQ
ncbi:MAG: VWA domain-containing protein [Pyrinomonadaceae bacterium]